MLQKLKLLAVVAVVSMPVSASALTILYEGGAQVPGAPAATATIGDLSNSTNSPLLSFGHGDSLWGRVAEGYADGATFNLAAASRVIFTLYPEGAFPFSGTHTFGGVTTALAGPLASVTQVAAAGNSAFLLDARPAASGSGRAYYSVEISAVPLPAALPLLLAALGGLGLIARRRRRAA